MGAVFTAAARAPLTSLASVVEMTGDFTLTLPVMLAVAVATATSRLLSYGTIYTTKLLRRGQDIDRAAPWRAFGDLKAADAMRPFPEPFPVAAGPGGNGSAAPALASLAGPVTYQGDPQAVFAGESITQALRQVEAYGRDGLPVLSGDGQQVQGWITGASVLNAVAREIGGSRPLGAPAPGGRAPGGPARDGRTGQAAPEPGPPTPLAGYQVLEVTVEDGSPAAGLALGAIAWPAGSFPVSVVRNRGMQDADPQLVLAPGDRVNLLARAPRPPAPRPPQAGPDGQAHLTDPR